MHLRMTSSLLPAPWRPLLLLRDRFDNTEAITPEDNLMCKEKIERTSERAMRAEFDRSLLAICGLTHGRITCDCSTC